MTEKEWVERLAGLIRQNLCDKRIRVETAKRLPYGYEIFEYRETPDAKPIMYQTDLALIEVFDNDSWRPRVIVEAKIDSITTHDAITYSRKADAHKTVHPYLRYGVVLGNRGDKALPGRLFRHGTGFDFMMSFNSFKFTAAETSTIIDIVSDEIRASRSIEKLLYESRLPSRDRYTVFRRHLKLQL